MTKSIEIIFNCSNGLKIIASLKNQSYEVVLLYIIILLRDFF
jgi:hypothetical protein